MAVATRTNRYIGGPSSTGLADVVDLILDKGLVIDLYVRVSLVGIELLTIDARIVVASVDTYLRFAEAVGRLDIESDSKEGLPELMQDMTSGGAKSKTSGALEGVKEQFQETFGSGDEEEQEDQGEEREQRSRPRRRRREREEE